MPKNNAMKDGLFVCNGNRAGGIIVKHTNNNAY